MAHRRSRNKVFIMGNAAADFEFLPGSNSAVAFSLATTEVWRDKQTQQQQEKTEWHRCVAFNRTAEYLVNFGRKGSLVDIEGQLQTRKWEDQQGQERYTTEIKVTSAQIIDGWKNEQSQQAGNSVPAQNAQSYHAPQDDYQPVPQASYPSMDLPPADLSDDIPGFEGQNA